MLYSLARVALVGAFLLPLVVADDLFAGCYINLPNARQPPPSGPATRASASACSVACQDITSHGYYNATSRECFCSNGTPFSTSLVVGNANACGNNYDNRITRSSFMELTPLCYASRPAGTTPQQSFTGLNGCLLSCRNGLRATYWATGGGQTNYQCSCTFPTSYGAGATCGPTTYFGFYHTPEAAASGLTRRQQREALLAKNDRPPSYCPNGWTACKVDEYDDEAYECIDTKSDLESCGGCRLGQHASYNGTVGHDCSFMTGSVLGGSTCLNGKCEAFACAKGYTLVDGECVRR